MKRVGLITELDSGYLDGMKATPICLSIAGSDPSGGAGIQGDLKSFCALGVYGMAVPAALTVQNSHGVRTVHALPAELVHDQIAALLEDSPPDAIKLGMLGNGETAAAVAHALANWRGPLIIDPVLVSSSGARMLDDSGVGILKSVLIPRCAILTPNAAEAAELVGCQIASISDMELAAAKLRATGAACILITGGDTAFSQDRVVDILASGDVIRRLESPRIVSRNTHGTGCALSAAICACLGRGMALLDAVAAGREFVRNGLSVPLSIGGGTWPINHLKL